MSYVGVGPVENFRARKWWQSLRAADTRTVMPVEAFAPLSALRDSRRIWRKRHAYLQMLSSSAGVRQHAVVSGCDCWPLVREELAGIAWLQWPWSARAMDEAGAALDALAPGVLVNAVCPGWVATDMGGPGGRPVAEGAAGIVWAATLPDDGPTGGFFRDGRPIPW